MKSVSEDDERRWGMAVDFLNRNQFIWLICSKYGYTHCLITSEGEIWGRKEIAKEEEMLEKWAEIHRVRNRYDMGLKNWERCKYDLNLSGGFYHDLVYDDEGYLQYR